MTRSGSDRLTGTAKGETAKLTRGEGASMLLDARRKLQDERIFLIGVVAALDTAHLTRERLDAVSRAWAKLDKVREALDQMQRHVENLGEDGAARKGNNSAYYVHHHHAVALVHLRAYRSESTGPHDDFQIRQDGGQRKKLVEMLP